MLMLWWAALRVKAYNLEPIIIVKGLPKTGKQTNFYSFYRPISVLNDMKPSHPDRYIRRSFFSALDMRAHLVFPAKKQKTCTARARRTQDSLTQRRKRANIKPRPEKREGSTQTTRWEQKTQKPKRRNAGIKTKPAEEKRSPGSNQTARSLWRALRYRDHSTRHPGA